MKKIVLALALALVTVSALAGTLAGVSMNDTSSAGGTNLVLNGMALRTKLFVKVYVGGLYLPTKERDATKVITGDSARQMVMHWTYAVDNTKICEGWQEGLAANTPSASAELKADFAKLCGMTNGAEKGDRLVFTYVPGQGTEIEVKGESKGTIAGKAFADALLACWIGPKPGPGEDFKKALLGG
jgi:Chalcone isomerase-like